MTFITPYCGLLFQCGCRQVWAGGAHFCNVHAASGHHCPFCSHGSLNFYLYIAGGIVGAQFLALFAWFRTHRFFGLVAAVVLFFAGGGFAAYWAAVHDGYFGAPHPALACASSQAESFDHSDLDQLLSRYVNDQGWVDYDGLNNSRAQLDRYLTKLAAADPEKFGSWCDRLAFWMNSYNAFTLADVLDDVYGKSHSVRDIDGFFDHKRHSIASQQLTLDEIERRGRDIGDPRIHFAIVCASTSCPKLQRFAYRGRELDSQLERATQEFLSDSRKGARIGENRRLLLSPIFKWYAGDFSGAQSGVGRVVARLRATVSGNEILDYVGQHAPPGLRKIITEKKPSLGYLDYDWSLNAQSMHRPRVASQ